MVRFSHNQSPHFDHWLDAFVRGKSTPAGETAADETLQPAEFDQLQDAARQFHGLAAQADQQQDEYATTDRLDHIWEHVMATSQAVSPSTITPVVPSTSFQGRSPGMAPPIRLGSRWQGAINSILAAVLILGMTFGAWKTYENLDGGGGGDAEPSQIAALVNQDGTPESGATLTGTPVANDSLVVLPKAEDCTVEPLTEDEVMEIVDDPGLGERQRTGELVGTLESARLSDALLNHPPSQEDLDAISEAHRQWVACALGGNWFQVWALTDRFEVQREVRDWLYPTYLTREEGRALLFELQENGKAEQLPTTSIAFGPESSINLVDPNPEHSNQLISGISIVEVGMITYNLDGSVARSRSAAYADQQPLGQYITYQRDALMGGWKIRGSNWAAGDNLVRAEHVSAHCPAARHEVLPYRFRVGVTARRMRPPRNPAPPIRVDAGATDTRLGDRRSFFTEQRPQAGFALGGGENCNDVADFE